MIWPDRNGDGGIAAMCDHGAKQFTLGKCNVVRFDCWINQVEVIKKYMADNHPGVRFFCSWIELAKEVDNDH